MNNNYILYIIYLFLMSFGVLYSDDNIFLEGNNFKNLCAKLESFDRQKNEFKRLNAYDRAESKIEIKKKKTEFLNNYFIIKLTSDEYQLKDYSFDKSYFEIKNMKINSRLKINTKTPVFLNVKKEDAKMMAAKKELGILDLYMKVKINNIENFSENYCNDSKRNGVLEVSPDIYEYFFMCAQSGNIIDYEPLKTKEKFIKEPYINLKNKKKLLVINNILKVLENRIYKCKIKFEGFGVKIYRLDIDKYGNKHIKLENPSFDNKNLENCVDDEIRNLKFPENDKGYSVYFSVVISNI